MALAKARLLVTFSDPWLRARQDPLPDSLALLSAYAVALERTTEHRALLLHDAGSHRELWLAMAPDLYPLLAWTDEKGALGEPALDLLSGARSWRVGKVLEFWASPDREGVLEAALLHAMRLRADQVHPTRPLAGGLTPPDTFYAAWWASVGDWMGPPEWLETDPYCHRRRYDDARFQERDRQARGGAAPASGRGPSRPVERAPHGAPALTSEPGLAHGPYVRAGGLACAWCGASAEEVGWRRF